MHLLKELTKKHLKENFSSSINSIESFFVDDRQYFFTENYKNTITLLLKTELSKNLLIEKEKFSIAGGSVLTLLMYGSPFLLKDIDIFPCSQDDYNSLEKKLDEKAKKEEIRVTENLNSKSYKFAIEIDLIKKFYPTTRDCLNAFDLSICQFGFDEKFNFLNITLISDIFKFKNRVVNEILPGDAFHKLRRILKYAEKGFKISDNRLIELFSIIKSGEKKYKTDGPQDFFTLETEDIFNKGFLKVLEETKIEASKSYHTLKTKDSDIVELRMPELADLSRVTKIPF